MIYINVGAKTCGKCFLILFVISKVQVKVYGLNKTYPSMPTGADEPTNVPKNNIFPQCLPRPTGSYALFVWEVIQLTAHVMEITL